jgi:predicted esterase YcpF (UPF0227 family)
LSSVIYLHGFNSSPGSEKASLTKEYFQEWAPDIDFYVPQLPPAPMSAISTVETLVESIGVENLAGFIGSSLGGYYSLYLQKRFVSLNPGLKVVLINPAVKPFELLSGYLGENQNPYTGESYTVESEHMDQLRSLSSRSISTPMNTFLLAQTGDEVLDYYQSVSHLNGAKMWLQYGGDHSFIAFNDVLPAIRLFLVP